MNTCTLCQKNFKTSQGLAGHNFFVHSNRSVARKIPSAQLTKQYSGRCAAAPAADEPGLSKLEHRLAMLEQATGVEAEQAAQLAEQAKILTEKDGSIAQLREEVIKKQTDLEVSQIRVAELEAELAQIPKSIADFPAAEQSVYFTQFLKNLTTEDKACLAEETGFGVTQKTETVPLAEVAQGEKGPERLVPRKKLVVTYNGKSVLVSRG